jgi:hypothetical protein
MYVQCTSFVEYLSFSREREVYVLIFSEEYYGMVGRYNINTTYKLGCMYIHSLYVLCKHVPKIDVERNISHVSLQL